MAASINIIMIIPGPFVIPWDSAFFGVGGGTKLAISFAALSFCRLPPFLAGSTVGIEYRGFHSLSP